MYIYTRYTSAPCKVIHGDISARNILLAYGKVAKISDFGLSKKLYQYSDYVKKGDVRKIMKFENERSFLKISYKNLRQF